MQEPVITEPCIFIALGSGGQMKEWIQNLFYNFHTWGRSHQTILE
jgi:hypothetical protein